MAEILFRIGEGNKQFKAISKALSISVLNQFVSSGTNFVLGIYLVRVLTPVEFGFYGIGFAISLVYAGIGNSLFLTQMVVNIPDKPQADRLAYAASMGKGVLIFCGVTFLLILFVLPGLGAAWTWLGQYAGYGLAVTGASVAYLLKDFFVRHAYTVRKEIWALVVNVAVAATLAVLLFLQHFQTINFTATWALWIYTASHLTAVSVGQILARLPILAVQCEQMIIDYREAWAEGRWALVTTLMYSLRTQAYIFVTAWGLGPVGVAYLNASRLLVTPATMLTPALSQVFLPRLAELRIDDRRRMVYVGMLYAVLLLTIALGYSGILFIFLDRIVLIVLGGKYHSMFGVVLGWCIFVCLLAVSTGGSLILQVLKKFRILMVINTISAFIAIILVVTFIKWIGLFGAIYSLVIAEFLLSCILWSIIKKDINFFR